MKHPMIFAIAAVVLLAATSRARELLAAAKSEGRCYL
jgi:hypothetical protein